MIHNWQELGEELAEFENRIALIENSMPNHREEQEERQPEPEWLVNQWDIVQQLQSEIRGWRTKYNETLNELEKLLKLNEKKPKSKWE